MTSHTATIRGPRAHRGPLVEPRTRAGGVAVTAVILAKDESANIGRAISSVWWCSQVVVVDSGSTDGTPERAEALGATVLRERWRGFPAQREWMLRHPVVANDWIYFLDADEWIPPDLAAEIAERLGEPGVQAYRQRRRLVFMGRWIAHCGWYRGSWQVKLMDRRSASYADAETYGERATIDGRIGTLRFDVVDDDAKGLAAWLHKHIGYAELEAERRRNASGARSVMIALATSRAARRGRPVARTVAKEVVFPVLPAKAFVKFFYMFVLRGGWRDGRPGLAFCFFHAWHEFTVGQILRSSSCPKAR
ncbi:MAG: glycosyltransferase family 2 protein [Frankia sp.]